MDVSNLIAQLTKLQLEQNKILEQLAVISNTDKTQNTVDKKHRATDINEDLKIGDHGILLTGGTRCKKGNKARVTKITDLAVHFVVLRNDHHTYKKHWNAQKVSP